MISKTEQDLNDELLNMALSNFEEFAKQTGFDMARAHICLLKSKGKSYAQIAIILKKSRPQVIGIYKRNCNCKQS